MVGSIVSHPRKSNNIFETQSFPAVSRRELLTRSCSVVDCPNSQQLCSDTTHNFRSGYLPTRGQARAAEMPETAATSNITIHALFTSVMWILTKKGAGAGATGYWYWGYVICYHIHILPVSLEFVHTRAGAGGKPAGNWGCWY